MIEKHQYFGAFLLYSDIQAPTYNDRFLSEEMDEACNWSLEKHDRASVHFRRIFIGILLNNHSKLWNIIE